MLKRTAAFFRPHVVTLILFLALALLLPVVYVYAEPERTNYLPGEQQHWDLKVKIYNGLLDEVFLHTDGAVDDLLGILHRDYLANYIGLPLLFVYYFITSALKYILYNKVFIKSTSR
jgi:hypothetical protein